MRHDLAERLEFVRTQLRAAERAFMGGGFVHAVHDELDRLQIYFSSQPSVLQSIKDTRSALIDFLKSKINGRLTGEDGNHHPVAVWHSFNKLEQAIRMISVAEATDHRGAATKRLTVAA